MGFSTRAIFNYNLSQQPRSQGHNVVFAVEFLDVKDTMALESRLLSQNFSPKRYRAALGHNFPKV